MISIRELIDEAGEFTIIEAKEVSNLLRTTHSVKVIFSHLQYKMSEVARRFPHTALDLGEIGKLQGEYLAYQNLLEFFVLLLEESEQADEMKGNDNELEE